MKGLIRRTNLSTQVQEANLNLTEIDQQLIRAGNNESIKEMDGKVYGQTIRKVSKYTALDLGIQNLDDYQQVRFADIVARHYSFLTVSEVKLAFELLLVGRLDIYLPQGKDGPEKKHYQSFSVEFVTKVLNAFVQYRGKTTQRISKLIPQESSITEEQKAEIHQSYIDSVIDLIRNWYVDKSKIEDWRINSFLFDFFEKVGIVKELQKKELKEHFSHASEIYQSKQNNFEARFAESEMKKGRIVPGVLFKAEQLAHRKLIIEALEGDRDKKGENLIQKIKDHG